MLDEPTVILLDMTMPTFDVGGKETGGYERRYACFEVLRRLKRRRKARRVIIVTQFERFGEGADQMTLDQLKEQLATQYPENYIVTVYYQASDAQWREDLKAALEMAIERVVD
jgi:CheY-like chemotaxis protein